jgi:hypothetical protein
MTMCVRDMAAGTLQVGERGRLEYCERSDVEETHDNTRSAYTYSLQMRAGVRIIARRVSSQPRLRTRSLG